MCETKKKYKQHDISKGYIVCKTCHEEKSLDYFYNNNGYYNYTCKECVSEKYKSNSTRKKYKQQDINSGMIKCRTCGGNKPINHYGKSGKGYYNYECKECLKNKPLKQYKKLTDEQVLFNQGIKICKKCQEPLPLSKFLNESPKIFRKSTCIDCLYPKRKDREKELLKKNEISKANKALREEKRRQRELLLQQREVRRRERLAKQEEKNQKKEEYKKLMEYYASDEWKEIKKQKERDRQRKKWKRKWEEDEMFAMKVRLRNLIRNSFRRGGYRKFETSTEEVVGLKYDEFKKHLESKFLDGMSWENRGEWHIDHIIPLSSANSKEELIKLCHYSNFQPLWAEDNISKGDRM